jgi:hypothetical protein
MRVYQQGVERGAADTENLANMLLLLHMLRGRYSGAEFVTRLVDLLMRCLPRKFDQAWEREKLGPASSDICGLFFHEDELKLQKAVMNTMAWAQGFVRECFVNRSVVM